MYIVIDCGVHYVCAAVTSKCVATVYGTATSLCAVQLFVGRLVTALQWFCRCERELICVLIARPVRMFQLYTTNTFKFSLIFQSV